MSFRSTLDTTKTKIDNKAMEKLPKEITPEIYKSFVKWKAIPLTPSAPQNIQDFAERKSVPIESLYKILELENFAEDLRKETLQWSKLQMPRIMHSLFNEITSSKSSADAERFMKIAYEMNKREKEGGSTYNIVNQYLNDETYKKIIAREARSLDQSSGEQTHQLRGDN